MTALYAKIFRASLTAFPHEFRDQFADEMALVFDERCKERPVLRRPFFAVEEILAVGFTAARFRIAGHSRHQAMKAAVVLAMLASTLTMRAASPEPQSRIDFNGHDPAGAFTLTVVNGKAIAATLNRKPVSRPQIIQKGRDISIIDGQGEVALALIFDGAGQISWKARR